MTADRGSRRGRLVLVSRAIMSRYRRVLLVGSCAKLADRLAVLQRATVQVRSTANAAEALELHLGTHADLIVTDLDLADSTAEQLCDALRANAALRNVSILVVCGPGERRRAETCRANGHVVRPIDAAALADRITRLMTVSLRAPYRVLTQVTTAEQGGVRSFFCTSENVSTAGILIETSEALDVGQALDCSFFLPGRLRLVAQGRVVRQASSRDGRRFGIQFAQLSRRESVALERFVDRWGTLR
jgi:CheY-like chemotaxis protein